MNIALLLTALPVLCTPVAGSVLRLPDAIIFSFTPEAVDARSFNFGDRHPIPDAYLNPPRTFDPVPDAPAADLVTATDIDSEPRFGPQPDIPPTPIPLRQPLLTLLRLGNALAEAEPSDFLFFITGLSFFTSALFIPIPRHHTRRIEQPPFSSHFPQIIHLTRLRRLP